LKSCKNNENIHISVIKMAEAEFRKRYVCFTLFEEPNIDTEKVQYYIYQKEICPTTGQAHYQGYIELKPRVRLRFETWKRDVFQSNKVHIEARKGTQEQAINYCRKLETRAPDSEPVVFGQPGPTPGERTDLERFMEEAKSGSSMYELRQTQPEVCAKYHSFTQAFVCDVQREVVPRWRALDVTVYWGPTEMGKTRRVYHQYPDAYKLDPCPADKLWWDGYGGESVLLIDDFYGWIPIGNLLNILDGYKLRLPVKGTFAYANWETVFITSNLSPENWYATKPLTIEQENALMRRLSRVIHVNTQWKPEELSDNPEAAFESVSVPVETLTITRKMSDSEYEMERNLPISEQMYIERPNQAEIPMVEEIE
jgi:hypothetical protein